MYYHVLKNVQRERISGYVLVKTYRNWKALQRWLEKTGEAVWVIESQNNWVPINGQHSQPGVGNRQASYWNTGGWGVTTMPLLPLFRK